jgi:hypothetical protein
MVEHQMNQTLSPKRTAKMVQFHWTVFAFLWSISILADRLKRGVYEEPQHILVVGACAFVLLKPTCIRRFILFSFIHLCWIGSIWSQHTMVHWYIAATMHAATVLATLEYLIRNRKFPKSLHDLWPSLKRAAQTIAAGGLFFAGFAKWNIDFLDPHTSCGGIYYLWYRRIPGLAFLPDSMAARQIAAYLAAVLETIGPILMVLPWTRRAGITLSWLVLLALAVNPRSHYFEFAGLFFACSIFFLSTHEVYRARLRCWWRLRKLLSSFTRLRRALGDSRLVALGSLLAILLTVAREIVLPHQTLLEGFRVLWVFSALLLVFNLSLFMRPAPKCATPKTWALKTAFLIPLLFVAKESSVYIGLTHRPALTMAANAAFTPAYSNHLLLDPLPTLHWLHDVHILESSTPALPKKKHMPWSLFRNLMYNNPDAKVRYSLNSAPPQEVVSANDPRLQSPSFIGEILPIHPYSSNQGPRVCGKPPPGISRTRWAKQRRRISNVITQQRKDKTPR